MGVDRTSPPGHPGQGRPGVASTLLAVLVLAGCGPDSDGAAIGDPSNGMYTGLADLPDSIRLTDGRWEGEPVAPGGASRPSVHMVPSFRVNGDLAMDGVPDTVIALAVNFGGSGEFLYAVVLRSQETAWSQEALLALGDRVQLRGGRIGNGALYLDLVEAGPGDAACCPGDVVTRGWRPDADGTLAPFDPGIPSSRLSWATLQGSRWVLRSWGGNDPVDPEMKLTLDAGPGRASGDSGCNRFSQSVQDGAAPGEIEFGAAAGTRKACPDPLMTIERRYLGQLAQVKKLGFLGGRLALSYQTAEGWDQMVFEPSGAVESAGN